MNKLPLTSYGQWQLVKLLGEGAFGEVHQWKHCLTGQEIATKRLKANAKLKPDEINILHKRWQQEYKWAQDLRTPFIVCAAQINDTDFLNYLTEQNHVEYSLPVIVMEYCNGGDLRHELNKIKNLNGLIEHDVRNILYALICAIKYLHQICNIEHRDIKPENIVSHIQGNAKVYKLTDFGYAREIPDQTIAQSVVGTRNYVAPEVIDPGIYTKTVDYWSIGIVAYELICGTQPFIPHQTFVNRMRSIQCKPPECIAIIQKPDDSNEEKFEFINYILPQNRSSFIFINDIEKWLRLALDKDYKTRGCSNNNVLKFYSDFEKIMQKKIVTVFSLKTYKKYYYNIESCDSLQKFSQQICTDNNIDFQNIFFIYPPLHPHKNSQYPVDYFVQEWCDISNPDNPPAMLFVADFIIKRECNIDESTHFIITDTIRRCLCLNSQDDNIPEWILRQFEKEVHFIIANEQHCLECYLMGLQNYIIEIEYVIFQYRGEMDMLNKKTSELSGSIKHSNVVFNEIMNIQNGQASTSATQTSNKFAIKIQDLQSKYYILLANYNAVLQNCKILANNKIYEEYAKKDIFELLKYEKSLSIKHSLPERLENAQSAFEKCMLKFSEFIRSHEWNAIRGEIGTQLEKFNLLRQNVFYLNNEIDRLENELHDFTRSLLRNVTNDMSLSLKMDTLHIDGAKLISLSNDSKSLNVFDSETPELINDFETILNAMESTMNTD